MNESTQQPKLTRQGVRDLGDTRKRRRAAPPPGTCEHRNMRKRRGVHCCLDCGLSWGDEGEQP